MGKCKFPNKLFYVHKSSIIIQHDNIFRNYRFIDIPISIIRHIYENRYISETAGPISMKSGYISKIYITAVLFIKFSCVSKQIYLDFSLLLIMILCDIQGWFNFDRAIMMLAKLAESTK